MKKKIIRTIIFIVILTPESIYGQSSFIAQMVNTVKGTERVYKFQSDGKKYRYDFEESGMRGIVIVNPEEGKTGILMPDEKYVHFTPRNSRTSRMNDPYPLKEVIHEVSYLLIYKFINRLISNEKVILLLSIHNLCTDYRD